LEDDVSISKLLRKGVAASEQIQQAEHRNDKQLFHNGSLGNDREEMGSNFQYSVIIFP
jgi:hypothetical protein